MRVLVAEDSLTIRTAEVAILNRLGFEVLAACNGEDAWRALQSPDAPRLALLDWEMPGMDGAEICRRVRERESNGARYTYVILLTSRSETGDIVRGMEAGADDYIVKPFDQHELRVRMRAGQRIVELQTELYRLQEKLNHQARTDALTGCLNRRAILERLDSELARARRERRPLALGMLDIDNFKRVNDTHGHAVGDEVLRQLVRRLQSVTRASDVFGRVGGEEFLALWPANGIGEALIAAERVRACVGDVTIQAGGVELIITTSIGITTSTGFEEANMVIARADEALYAAKQNGRDRTESVLGPHLVLTKSPPASTTEAQAYPRSA